MEISQYYPPSRKFVTIYGIGKKDSILSLHNGYRYPILSPFCAKSNGFYTLEKVGNRYKVIYFVERKHCDLNSI